ncbi:MAG: pentapeptide repeat-containing protein [Candidatus Caenarcaniphilales bacterium]|nr:pentapeptide repeat-containing protein [Candidatus Caenarcaniphilales bacterium]
MSQLVVHINRFNIKLERSNSPKLKLIESQDPNLSSRVSVSPSLKGHWITALKLNTMMGLEIAKNKVSDFTQKNITKIYRNENLSGKKFIDQDLSSYKFINCNLHGAQFKNCNLDKTLFDNCDMQETELIYSSKKEVKKTKIKNCNLKHSLMKNISFVKSEILNCNHDSANIRNCSFWRGTNFQPNSLKNTYLTSSSLPSINEMKKNQILEKLLDSYTFNNTFAASHELESLKFKESQGSKEQSDTNKLISKLLFSVPISDMDSFVKPFIALDNLSSRGDKITIKQLVINPQTNKANHMHIFTAQENKLNNKLKISYKDHEPIYLSPDFLDRIDRDEYELEIDSVQLGNNSIDNFEPFFDIKNKSKRTEYGGGKSPVNEIKKAELSPITDQRMMYILAIMLHESIDNNTEIIIQKDKDKVTKKLSSLYFYENGFINYINSEQNEKNRKLLRELRLAIDPFRNN